MSQSKKLLQAVGSLGAGVLRLLHLRDGGISDFSADSLSIGQSHDRHRRVTRDLRRRLCCSAIEPLFSDIGATRMVEDVLIVCMFLMGFQRWPSGFCRPISSRRARSSASRDTEARTRLRCAGEISGASSMILEHAPLDGAASTRASPSRACRPGRSSPRRFPAACAYMPDEAFNTWAGEFPSCSSFFVIIAGYIIRRNVDETPAFAKRVSTARFQRRQLSRLSSLAGGTCCGSSAWP